MDIKIEVKDLETVKQRMEQRGEDFKAGMTKTMDKSIKYVHSQVPAYPPPIPTQTYIRTGTLGRSIHTQVKPQGKSITGIIGTNLKYAPYVIKDLSQPKPHQAKPHIGRWWTLEKVVEKQSAAIQSIFDEWIKEVLSRK